MQPLIRLSFGVLALSVVSSARADPGSPGLSGQRDESIRTVVGLVARHQVHELADGDYPSVGTTADAEAARAPEGIAWNYPWGVALYGEIRSYDATGDKGVLQFALRHDRIAARYFAWLDSVKRKLTADQWRTFLRSRRGTSLHLLLTLGSLDSCGAMGVQMLEGMLRRPNQATEDEKRVVERIADWIVNRQPRLPDGTLWRPRARDETRAWPAGTIWADDLYMACPFLVRWSEYTHNPRYLTDAARQIINMSGRLQDKDGVWFHAYSVKLNAHSPYKWGRANGWIAVATVEVLSAMPENHPLRSELLSIYRRHMNGIIGLQPASGVWRQVLDHPETWAETSCTGMFAYAIARGVNRGWLPEADMEYARKAFAGLCGYITSDGVVNDTCQGTGIGSTLEYYIKRRHPADDPHSRGIVQLSGTEILAGHSATRGSSGQ